MWARAALAGGLLLLAATFATAVGDLRPPLPLESAPTTTVGGRTYGCGSVIPSSWLVAGTPDSPAPAPRSVRHQVAARCTAAVHHNRVVFWGVMGVGGLAVLVGFTALREHGSAGPGDADEFAGLGGSVLA